MKKSILLGALAIFISYSSCKKNGSAIPDIVDADVEVKVLSDNLSHPWDMVWGTDNMIWMTERGGRISRVDPISGQVSPLITVSDVVSNGEGGLLGIALHPDFATVPQVFVVYNYTKNGTYTEKVVRYTYGSNTLSNPVVILDNIAASSIHNGSRLLFAPDKKLLITTGDASNQPSAQNPASLSGKVLRINPDGTIPSDNPNPASAVWTLGHRNPQGLAYGNGKLYSSEHGANSDDEINIIEKGRNYGWPNVEGMCNTPSEQTFCTANNVFQPISSWTPTLAVCGIDYYGSDAIPQWKHSIIMATLKDNTLYQLKLSADGLTFDEKKEIFRGTYGRLRDVLVAPNGKVYVATGNGNSDKIVVLQKKP